MSGRKCVKTAKMDDSSSGSDSDMNGEDCDSSAKGEEIQVDFEGRNPTDGDFHGIRQLLQQLFLKSHINLSQLTDIIIGQNQIGSVIIQSDFNEQDDDDDDDDIAEDNTVFGITTIVNISNKRDVECIKQLHTYILEKAATSSDRESVQTIKDVLESAESCVGFLLNERFVNIPAQISVPLFETLYKEIKEASAKRKPYNFTHVLAIVKFHRLEAEAKKPSEDYYSNQEEEIICKDVLASFEYSVKDEADTGLSGDWTEDDSSMTPYRKVILFDANKLSNITETIKDYVID